DGHAAHLALQLLALAAGGLTALAVRSVPESAPRWALAVAAAVPLLLGVGTGVVLMTTDLLIAASWFGATGRTWWADALADQQRAGVAVLAVVGLTAVIVAVVMRSPSRRRGAAPATSAAPPGT
ncbi:MAG: copper-binding protein, partial [Brachybacterium sp.]|nr:copper-binding protein [Brachybacterium sp.]